MIEINKDTEGIRAKNHYVPKVYLRNWCDSDNQLWVYRSLVSDANVKFWKKTTPAAVAYHSHLYTKLGDKNLDDEVEKWFDRDFESPAHGAINRVLVNLKLSQEDWKQLNTVYSSAGCKDSIAIEGSHGKSARNTIRNIKRISGRNSS